MRLMTNDNYNGWTNRETWAVRLLIDNERESYLHWREVTQEVIRQEPEDAACGTLARRLEETFDDLAPQLKQGLFADLLSTAVARIDWHEIARSMIEDADEGKQEQADSEWPVIHSYSRAQAIADGVLVDVTELAKEAGFKLPVVMTSAAWAKCVSIPSGVTCQDETGRLWDVLSVLFFTIRAQRESSDPSEIRFMVSVHNSNDGNEDVALKALCSPGDDAEPVVTILLLHED